MKAPEIKEALLCVLKSNLDADLEMIGFRRPPKSLIYTRTCNGTKQQFALGIASNPSYSPGKLAHLTPALRIENRPIGDLALQLVEDPWLLANCPSMIQNQRLTLLTRPQMPEWYISSLGELNSVIAEIGHTFITQGLSFLESYATASGMIAQHESGDRRALLQQRYYVFVIAAYLIENRRGGAISLLEDRFSKPGIRKKFSALWNNLHPDQGNTPS